MLFIAWFSLFMAAVNTWKYFPTIFTEKTVPERIASFTIVIMQSILLYFVCYHMFIG